VIDRVHSHTSDRWSAAAPTISASFTKTYVRLLGIANRANGGAGANVYISDFT
jgi:hypothetical protein